METIELIKNGKKLLSKRHLLERNPPKLDIKYFIIRFNHYAIFNQVFEYCILIKNGTESYGINPLLIELDEFYNWDQYNPRKLPHINILLKSLPTGLEITVEDKYTHDGKEWYVMVGKDRIAGSLEDLVKIYDRNHKIDKLT